MERQKQEMADVGFIIDKVTGKCDSGTLVKIVQIPPSPLPKVQILGRSALVPYSKKLFQIKGRMRNRKDIHLLHIIHLGNNRQMNVASMARNNKREEVRIVSLVQ